MIAIASLVKKKKAIVPPEIGRGDSLPPTGPSDPEEEGEEDADDEEEDDAELPKTVEEKCACGKSAAEMAGCQKGADCSMKKKRVAKADHIYIPIMKADAVEQTVTGVVLQPEVVDAQGDIYDADVIKAAAYDFLANYNRATKLGKQHNDFKSWSSRFALVESYLLPMEMAINSSVVKAGSWIMTVKVLDSKVWKLVKEGKITGFSIGGKAKAQDLSPAAT